MSTTAQAEAVMHAASVIRAYRNNRELRGTPVTSSLARTAMDCLWSIAHDDRTPDWLHERACMTLSELEIRKIRSA